MNGLDYMFDLAKRPSVKKSAKPWVIRTDVEDFKNDVAHDKAQAEKAAPILFLYFDASSSFQGAVICADLQKVFIESWSCVSNAVLCYISIFHACQVGYNDHWQNFLATLEHVLLGVPFKGSNYRPIKLDNFIHWWKNHNINSGQ